MNGAELAGGIALAAGAAACFDGAVALQAVEARAIAHARAGAGLLRSLVARPRWLAASALAVLGWPLQIAALSLAPLTVVQPTLALGLVVLLILGVRLLHEPARPKDLLAAGAIAGGVGILAWAAPEPNHVHAGAASLAAVLGGLAIVTATPWVAKGHVPGRLLVVAAGCGYAASGLTTKLLADELARTALTAAIAWGALTAALAAVALADEMSALQRVGAARVAAGAFALQVLVPVAFAPVLTGEHWGATPLGGGAILAGLALVLGGATKLGTTSAVSRLVAGSRRAP
jgi:drug/metabolite transporter (DMT)-like permease